MFGLGDRLHAFTAAGPVAVVKVQAFALEDEGANAILRNRISTARGHFADRMYLRLCYRP